MLKNYILILLMLLSLVSCRRPSPYSEAATAARHTMPANRMAAEWEPALGAIIAWPLDIPHQLVIELAKDAQLYTMVPDEEEKVKAIGWYQKWNIEVDKVVFIIAPQGWDSWWVRDWGPFAVFGADGAMSLADGQYAYSTPSSGTDCDEELVHVFTERDSSGNEKILLTTTDDIAPASIAIHIGVEALELPFTFTGGNVFTDGRGTALSTCIIKNENRFIGGSNASMLSGAEELLGIQQYYFISNFEERGIQHIDCFLKMLDEERLLVARTPLDHPLHKTYEDIVDNELVNLQNIFGRPYTILRLDTDRYHDDDLAAYTNSLILNQNIYVPLFGIAQDSVALSQWQQAMPGYAVKGFKYVVDEEPVLHPSVKNRRSHGFGWNEGDALHCRTRAMWDPEMLYLSVNRIPEFVPKANAYRFNVVIIDYSKQGIIPNASLLHWREQGNPHWSSTALLPGKVVHIFSADIKLSGPDKIIEFFIATESKSGRKETMPRTAPAGLYTFSL
ncbi:MAG: agmatine deiminase family protein [Saprospiraceae bacterium]|nr:agmatine deiminase family protein [Saprospiraceae bacterium]